MILIDFIIIDFPSILKLMPIQREGFLKLHVKFKVFPALEGRVVLILVSIYSLFIDNLEKILNGGSGACL